MQDQIKIKCRIPESLVARGISNKVANNILMNFFLKMGKFAGESNISFTCDLIDWRIIIIIFSDEESHMVFRLKYGDIIVPDDYEEPPLPIHNTMVTSLPKISFIQNMHFSAKNIRREISHIFSDAYTRLRTSLGI